jgi:hypothetical protein
MTLWQGDLDHFVAFCRTLTLDNGRPFIVEPFQRTILRDYFGGARETLTLIPKKNGKTTLMAALLDYHLAFVDEASAYLVASSIKQAGICYDFAAGFVNRSAALQRRILVRAGTKELRSKRDGGTAVVLAAEAETADGVGPTLAIVDELHRAKSTALYDVLRDGLDARDGSMLAITTAGDDEDGALGVMRANYLAMPGKRITGRYTYVRSRDRSNVMHEWALRPDDDLDNLDLVKSVNPLRSMTKAKLRRRRDSPSMTTGAWARFACNVWTQGEDAAISTIDWARRARSGLRLPDGAGATKVIGIDLGWTKDTTALIPVGYPTEPEEDDDGELILPAEAWIDERLVVIPAGTQQGPPLRVRLPDGLAEDLAELAVVGPGKIEEGRMTDEAVVKGALIRLWLIWPDALFALDPNAGGQSLAQWIDRELCAGDADRVITYSQQPAPMQLASMHFAAGVRTTTVQEPVDDPVEDEEANRTVPLWHPDVEALNRHVRAAAARWNGDRWRFDKRTKPRAGSTRVQPQPIDGVIGATLGYRGLMQPADEGLQPFVMVGA